MSSSVVTRFAPSPTGYLHVGGARTALFDWLLARHAGGKFLLRIEDTDLARSTEQACTQLIEDLKWLGLHWDNPELVYQSKRLDVYNRTIDDLLARGLAYKAYETTEELEARRKEAEKAKKAFVYRRPNLTAEQLARYEAEGRPWVVRFAMPVREYRFRDEVLDKEVVLPAEEAQDFVIRKGDGMPTYHFAVVVDDAAMGITHVIRGQEHTKNTFYHIALQEALGYPRPLYMHVTTILNTDGTKMGKRDRDKTIRTRVQLWIKNGKGTAQSLAQAASIDHERFEEWIKNSQKQLDLPEQREVMPIVGMKESELPEILVHDFRKNGYLPEALLNFLALLGWSPGENRERMSMEEMVGLFSIEGIGVANAKFDRAKLLAFNTEACAAASPERLLAAFRDFLSVNPDSPLNVATDEQLLRVLRIKPGFHILREVEEQSRFFFVSDDQIAYDPAAVEKVMKKQGGYEALREIVPLLANAAPWAAHELEQVVKSYCEQKQLALGKVAQPIRVAISGTTISPPIFESLEFLGRDRTLSRIDRCLALASDF